MKKNGIDKRIILCAIIIIYIFLLLLFEPCFKVDDLYMNDIMVGTFSGKPDYHFIYGHFLVGLFVSKMTVLFPNVAWFACLQIFLLIVALYFVAILLCNNRKNLFILIPSFFIYEYMFMIKITFTQTAAVCFTTGMLGFLFYIRSGLNKHLAIGTCLVFFGLIFRIQALFMCVPFFLLTVLYYLCIINRYSLEEKRVIAIKTIIRIGLVYIIIFLLDILLTNSNRYVYKNDDIWNTYLSDNSIKSYFTDYNDLDYSENREAFMSMGISENDFLMLKTNNLYYKNSWYSDSIQKLYRYIKEQNNLRPKLDVKQIIKFLKNFINKYLSYSYLLWCIFLLYSTIKSLDKKLKLYILMSALLLFSLNYYLFIKGRVFQPHVDIGLIYCWFIAVLFVCTTLNEKEQIIKYNSGKKYKSIIPIILLLCIIMNVSTKRTVFYAYGDDYSANPDYSSELLNQIKNDKEHIYITTARESVYSLWDEKAFQGGLTGTKSNVFFMSQYLWPSCRDVLKRYNIENPMEEMVDSDTIRFFISDPIEAEQVEMVENYLKEHVNENSRLVKLEEYKTVNIYKCVIADEY